MRKAYLIIVSFLTSIFAVYLMLFIYTFFNFDNEFKHSLKSLEILNFHEKYSKKIHHIRDESVLNSLFKKPQVEDLLFSTVNEIRDKNIIVLFQGDSWMEQLTKGRYFPADLILQFGNKKKVGFVNAGISSYSPSLMNLQLDVLQEDFHIFPDIVIAYIDQTDIGDENCRYKNNKVYINGILNSVQPEAHLIWRDYFNYSEIYEKSKISLKNRSKILQTFHLTNFKIKYGLTKSSIRFYRKYISTSKVDKEKITKCYWSEIERYLINPKVVDVETGLSADMMSQEGLVFSGVDKFGNERFGQVIYRDIEKDFAISVHNVAKVSAGNTYIVNSVIENILSGIFGS